MEVKVMSNIGSLIESIDWASIVGGALLLFIFQEVIAYFRAGRGDLTGAWSQEIPPQEGEPRKLDVVRCREINGKLAGKIRREEPAQQKVKRWEFEGRRRGSLVFLTYWSTDRDRNPDSYGTIQLNRIGDNHWEGFYVKLITKPGGNARFTGELKQIQLDWKCQNRKWFFKWK